MARKMTMKEQIEALTIAGREFMARADTAEALLAADDRFAAMAQEIAALTAENKELRESLDGESDRSAKELAIKDDEIEMLAAQVAEFEEAKQDAENASWFAELAARPQPTA